MRATGSFPAGKSRQASQRPRLRRELHEELGIDVEQAYPWVTRDYDYAHAAVQLRFSRSRMVGHAARPGKPAVRMAAPRRGEVAPMLPANGPILRALTLPAVYGISNAADVGEREFCGGSSAR